jgi:hemerythrin-like metal-binding protein
MFINWNEGIETGNVSIDKQHKILLSLFNRLAKVVTDGSDLEEVGKILSSLSLYVVVHFEMEEGLMAGCGFEGTAEHLHRHALMRQQVETLVEKYNGHKLKAYEVMELLRNWIENHFQTKDRSLADFIRTTKISEKGA